MPTKKKTVKPKPVVSEQPSYEIVLVLGDREYRGAGESMLEALKSITPPVKITTKGTLTAVNGTKRMEMVMIVPKVKRLFYPLSQQILAKQLSTLLH
jgi:hypothetical protein